MVVLLFYIQLLLFTWLLQEHPQIVGCAQWQGPASAAACISDALHLRGAEEMMHGQETGDELTTDSLNIRGLWIFVFVCIHCR